MHLTEADSRVAVLTKPFFQALIELVNAPCPAEDDTQRTYDALNMTWHILEGSVKVGEHEWKKRIVYVLWNPMWWHLPVWIHSEYWNGCMSAVCLGELFSGLHDIYICLWPTSVDGTSENLSVWVVAAVYSISLSFCWISKVEWREEKYKKTKK